MNVRMCVCVWGSVHSIWVLIILVGICYKKCWNDTKENINGSLVIRLMGLLKGTVYDPSLEILGLFYYSVIFKLKYATNTIV